MHTHLSRGPSQCSVALGCCGSGTCIRLRGTELNCWMMSLLWEPRPQSYRHQEKHTVTVHHNTTHATWVAWDKSQLIKFFIIIKWKTKLFFVGLCFVCKCHGWIIGLPNKWIRPGGGSALSYCHGLALPFGDVRTTSSSPLKQRQWFGRWPAFPFKLQPLEESLIVIRDF